MNNIEIIGVHVDDDNLEVVVSLFGGPNNVVGTLSFLQPDSIKRHDMRRQLETLMEGHVLVDLAMSVAKFRWRLIGKNRVQVGGLEPTKLQISQTTPQQNKPKRIDEGGLGWPEAWGGED